MSSRPGVIFGRSSQDGGWAREIPAEGDAGGPLRDDNGVVGAVGSRYSRWADNARAFAASPRYLPVLGSTLAILGLVEVFTRAATSRLDVDSSLALGLLAVGSTLPLAVLGTRGAALFTSAASVLSLAGFHLLSVAGAAALLIALFRLGREPDGHFQLLAMGLAAPFLVLALVDPGPSSSESAILTVVLAALAPMAALGGVATESRREALENRAVREVITDTLIEHTVRGERARIARELHDVVAHHISMVAVQAESARLSVPGLPPAGAQRFSAIGDTARTALVEMRMLLDVLREDANIDVAERHPQPGLDQVTELVDEAREASGCATRLILRGAPIALDPNVELVAYRLIQEALSNARRHAPGAAADVELAYADSELRLRVRDNGPGMSPVAPAGGHGLTGMRERASAVGGTVRTGPALGGGYLVEAVLPAKIEEPA
jgi:signal transduction histidine kinase